MGECHRGTAWLGRHFIVVEPGVLPVFFELFVLLYRQPVDHFAAMDRLAIYFKQERHTGSAGGLTVLSNGILFNGGLVVQSCEYNR